MNSEQIFRIIDHLDLGLREDREKFSGVCPIHEGADNPTALNIMKHGRRWCCYTHQCEQHFQKNFIGFIRAYLSRKELGWNPENRKTVSYGKAKRFCEAVLGDKLPDIESRANSSEPHPVFVRGPQKASKRVFEPSILKSFLDYPCNYYLDRGFTKQILDKYEVGFCADKNRKMYNRAVFPMFDVTKTKITGCTGRSIASQCEKCGHYHPPGPYCNPYPKWLHIGFSRESELFNYWYAKEYIKQSKSAILVESPNCVMKFESFGIRNSVAILGTYLCYDQLDLLNKLGVMNLIVFRDSDNAGIVSSKDILEKCKELYHIVFPKIDYHDIADCPDEYIERKIIPLVKQYI